MHPTNTTSAEVKYGQQIQGQDTITIKVQTLGELRMRGTAKMDGLSY